MATRRKAARGRRATKRTASRRTTRSARGGRQRPAQGANLTRLLRADVLTLKGARSLRGKSLDAIEKLGNPAIDKLIEARKRVGRKPNCWLI